LGPARIFPYDFTAFSVPYGRLITLVPLIHRAPTVLPLPKLTHLGSSEEKQAVTGSISPSSLSGQIDAKEDDVLSSIGVIIRLIALAIIAVIPTAAFGEEALIPTSTLSEDSFPITGTYAENEACTAKSAEPTRGRVKITADAIDSNFGLCTISNKQRDGRKITAQITCKDSNGGLLMSGVTFTMRDDKVLDFVDQYQTYSTVLYKCPE
jgi:hypothetical protein